MSRLIFEGDTRERFGELFPRTFIEEIRIYDNEVSVDIALYFQIEEDVDVGEFLENTKLDTLNVLVGPISENTFNSAMENENALSVWLGSLYFREEAGLGTITNLTDVDVNYDLFYNSNGSKFIKFLITKSFSNFIASGEPQYLISFSFFLPESTDPLLLSRDKFLQFKTQFSAVSYEKVCNSDGKLSIERKNVYLQSDGNYYYDLPIRALDRSYRKSNLIAHEEILSLIEPIIQPYIGLISEADLISQTLQNFDNDPNLLLKIQENINNFSNKSSSTQVGTLYGLLVNIVVEIDNILSQSDRVTKRFEPNKKIRDLRRASFLPETSTLSEDTTSNLDYDTDNVQEFLYRPFLTRTYGYKKPIEQLEREGYTSADLFVKNEFLILFDHQKSLNYQSTISRYYNSYNIEQLFGKNCLNQYYDVAMAQYRKYSQGNTLVTYMGTQRRLNELPSSKFYSQYPDDNFFEIENNDGITPKKTFYSFIRERAFDTFDGIGDYKLRLYEISDLESAPTDLTPGISYDYEIEIGIQDSTMLFYENFIRKPLFDISTNFDIYVEFASQFCSYNNLDNRFNNFFIESVNSSFSEPYPWDLGPEMVLSLEQLNFSSLTQDSSGRAIRKKEAVLIDMESLREQIKTIKTQVSPSLGNLQSVLEFKSRIDQLKQVFRIGGTLDAEIEPIYDSTSTSEDYSLLHGSVAKRYIYRSRLYGTPINSIYELDFGSIEDTTYPEASSWSESATFNYNRSYDEFVDFFLDKALDTLIVDDIDVAGNDTTQEHTTGKLRDVRVRYSKRQRKDGATTTTSTVGAYGSKVYLEFLKDLIELLETGNYPKITSSTVSWVGFIKGNEPGNILTVYCEDNGFSFSDTYKGETRSPRIKFSIESMQKYFQILVPSIEHYNKAALDDGVTGTNVLTFLIRMRNILDD